MKEIGGYFQLEEMPGEEYYPDLYRVNLGRTALLWLLKSRRCRKILLPYFLCESVVHTCQENQIETEFYHLNEKLEVLCPKEQLPEGEYLFHKNLLHQFLCIFIHSTSIIFNAKTESGLHCGGSDYFDDYYFRFLQFTKNSVG